jgi:hypothetical protein
MAQWEPNPQYTVVTDVHHTMELIIDPAAEIIWGSAGSIITGDGEHDLAPSSAAAWTEVEAAAAILAESGNLLMMPGRSAGAHWNTFSSALTAAGQLATLAAQEQDGDALFDAGGQIYQACLGCHNQYLIEDGAKN